MSGKPFHHITNINHFLFVTLSDFQILLLKMLAKVDGFNNETLYMTSWSWLRLVTPKDAITFKDLEREGYNLCIQLINRWRGGVLQNTITFAKILGERQGWCPCAHFQVLRGFFRGRGCTRLLFSRLLCLLPSTWVKSIWEQGYSSERYTVTNSVQTL